MQTYILDPCGNKEFLFEFDFFKEKEQEGNRTRYVRFKLLRNDKLREDESFFWEGYLSTDEFVLLELSFADGINLKGEMKLYKNNGADYIWLNAYYCHNHERHFEGIIIKLP